MEDFLVLGGESTLAKYFIQTYRERCVALSKKQCDITNIKVLEKVIKSSGARYIVNCAAITDIEYAEKNPEKWIHEILNLLFSYFQGLIPSNSIIVDRLESFLLDRTKIFWTNVSESEIEKSICNVLTLHVRLKQFFSPTLTSNFVLFYELKNFINTHLNKKFSPSVAFKTSINELFSFYGIKNWVNEIQEQTINSKLSLYLILRAYHSCLKKSNIIGSLIKALGFLKVLQHDTYQLLEEIVSQEEAETDNSIALTAKNILNKNPFESKVVFPGLKEQVLSSNIANLLIKSLKDPLSDLMPNNLSSKTKSLIKGKIELLKNEGMLHRLSFGREDLIIYTIDHHSSKTYSYFLYYLIDNEPYDNATFFNKTLIPVKEIFSILNLLNETKQGIANCLEVIFTNSLQDNLYAKVENKYFWEKLNDFSMDLTGFFNKNIINQLIFNITFSDKNNIIKPTPLIFRKMADELHISLLLDSDPSNPYYNEKNIDLKTKLMVIRNKWPMETWISEAFDFKSFSEIKIESIDNIKWVNPKTQTEEIKPVASKIYIGSINETEACFYFKDSRVNGGATGNLEGLKYVAAVYLSKLKGIPLYVWNDGAGANIKEGMIALNRAAQGFMMNSISSYIDDLSKFRNFIDKSYDSTLKKLISDLDKSFDLNSKNAKEQINNHMIISVSIGSSSGLDVYGASQSTFQLILDDINCYRVLTGSKVISSVTGENLSNYDIGGARIMGKVTGTVDIVAKNKFELISTIKQLHETIVEKNCQNNAVNHDKEYLELSEVDLSEEQIIALFVDATEQPIQRPQRKQKKYYSSCNCICCIDVVWNWSLLYATNYNWISHTRRNS